MGKGGGGGRMVGTGGLGRTGFVVGHVSCVGFDQVEEERHQGERGCLHDCRCEL